MLKFVGYIFHPVVMVDNGCRHEHQGSYQGFVIKVWLEHNVTYPVKENQPKKFILFINYRKYIPG